MIRFFIILFFINNAFSFESYKVSFIFGSSNLQKMGEQQTYGSGLILRTELYEDEDWGYLVNAGVSKTESDEMIGGKNEFIYNSKTLQTGGFLSFANFFRVAAGISYFNIDEEHTTMTNGSKKFQHNIFGPFYEIGIIKNFNNFEVGIDYVAHFVDDFKQNGLYFFVGIGF